MTDGVEHVADLAVSPFMNRDLKGRMTIAAARYEVDVRRRHPMSLDRHTAREPIEIVRIRNTQDLGFVYASDAVTRVRQPRGQLAVVGENE